MVRHLKRLVFIISFNCSADPLLVAPPTGSNNLQVFANQFINYNSQRWYNNLKTNEGSVNHFEYAINHLFDKEAIPQDPFLIKPTSTITNEDKPIFTTTNGIDSPNKSIYQRAQLFDLKFKSSVDLNLSCNNELRYKELTTYFSTSLKDTSSKNMGIRYNKAW